MAPLPQDTAAAEDPSIPREVFKLCKWIGGIIILWILSLVSVPFLLSGATVVQQTQSLIGAILLYGAGCFLTCAVAILLAIYLKAKIARQFWYSSQCASFGIGLFGVIGATSIPSDIAKPLADYMRTSAEEAPKSVGRKLDEIEPICTKNEDALKLDPSARGVCDALSEINKFIDGARREREWDRLRLSLPDILKDHNKACLKSRQRGDGIVDLTNQYGYNINMSCRVALGVDEIDRYYKSLSEVEVFYRQNFPTRPWPDENMIGLRMAAGFGLVFAVFLNIFRIFADYISLLKK